MLRIRNATVLSHGAGYEFFSQQTGLSLRLFTYLLPLLTCCQTNEEYSNGFRSKDASGVF